MPDWSASMQQIFEYYIVDPGTWKDAKRINTVLTCSISRDESAETLGSATIDIGESVGECYIRAYLKTIQNGVEERHPLGTFIVQTPSSNLNGTVEEVSMDAYTPLLELKENNPPIGYSILKDENIMDRAYQIVRENSRAPVVKATSSEKLLYDFIADPSEKWLSFVNDLIANASFKLYLDELGRILFAPKQNIMSLQPVWTYTDDNSSIVEPAMTLDHDLYGVPNVVEVIYSSGSVYHHAIVENTDDNSPTSISARGRRITHRVTNPELTGIPTENQIQKYAEQLLKDLSSIEYTITYTHAYCPVRIGDCVRLDYVSADLVNVKAKVISQDIECTLGCPVTETAVFTKRLWR